MSKPSFSSISPVWSIEDEQSDSGMVVPAAVPEMIERAFAEGSLLTTEIPGDFAGIMHVNLTRRMQSVYDRVGAQKLTTEIRVSDDGKHELHVSCAGGEQVLAFRFLPLKIN